MSKQHLPVGRVINLDLQPQGNYVDVLVRRNSAEDAPLIIGQFISLVTAQGKKSEGEDLEIKDSPVFLGRVESFRPNIEPDLQLGRAMKKLAEHGSEMDEPYVKQTLFIQYRVRILGICEEKNGNVCFYSNVRTLPAVTSLMAAVPSADFMCRLFKSAVADAEDGRLSAFEIGVLKYGTFAEYTNKYYGGKNTVPVEFNAANLLRKRTGIFGKSGYGKSNTIKTIIGMMATEFPDCGQLIFDTNGEYALQNDQNDGFMDIFHEGGIKGRTVLYTARKIHASKKEKFGESSFKPLRFDVYENISAALDIVVANLAGATVPMYLQSWVNEAQGVENQQELFTNVNNKGIVWGLWFKACKDAGLTPMNETTNICTLQVNRKFLNELANADQEDEEAEESEDEETEEKNTSGFEALNDTDKKRLLDSMGIVRDGKHYVTRNIETMIIYADWYADDLRKKEKAKKDGDSNGLALDKNSSIKGYIELLNYYRRLYQLKGYHLGQIPAEDRRGAKSVSLGDSVWSDLRAKKIVMIDLASVPGNVSKSITEQIAATLLNKASQMFGDTEMQEQFRNFDVLVFIEEAQNYLSTEQMKSGSGIYERLAKEGRKFHLGLVYVTQQPSAIDETITSQTENIVAMHMSNNSDTMILNRIKDKFDEVTCKFLKDEAEKGLAYLYAEPHQPFVLPAQIHKFDKDLILRNLKKRRK